ncbi:MAG: aminotransferase class I/II-fold pyridoxal phosphate-dependent enzyme [Clostridia bacterium]|nr:aminotransferase class I/II-fold pyridoxal phosphate-dependent enzyme [Clostridia bacterium]
MRNFVSKKASTLKPSGIRKFFDLCAGSKDIISLGVGEPDFLTPWQVSEAGIRTIKTGKTQYTSNKGTEELRAEISAYLSSRFNVNYSKNEVIVTVGASEAIDIALRAILDDGDEVLIPEPSYVSYEPCVTLSGGVAVPLSCVEKDDFKLTAEALERAITPKTKALILPFPNNPTGAIMEKEYIEKIVPIILKHDILVISDEIYAELTYGQKHFSIASIPEMKNNVVLISGFSKAFAMTGWRVGYVCATDPVLSAMLKIHQYVIMCAPTFSQYAATEGLRICKNEDFSIVNEMRDEYDRRRKFMIKAFNDMGLHCFEPKGAFYVFPCVESTGMTGQEFATKLLNEKKVAVVPGDAFGESGKYFIRCSYAYSMKSLIKATELIKTFVEENKKP